MTAPDRQTGALLLSAAALGALALARAWRRSEAYDFAGRTALITGGSRGLGLILARPFLTVYPDYGLRSLVFG